MPPSIWIILGPALLLVALAALLPLLVQTGRRPPDDGYRGIFYCNPDDPALLVPKRFGIGYTLNFGNPRSWVVLALIVLVATLPIMFSVISVPYLPK